MKTPHILLKIAAFALGATLCIAQGYQALANDHNVKDTLKALKAHDRAVYVHDHWIRDPYIFLDEDGWYYLTGTTLKSEDDKVIGIPCWRSQDLANWEKLDRLWAVTDSAWMPDKHGGRHQVPETLVWAPELRKIDDRWIIVHTSNGAGSNMLVSEGSDIQGPYVEPMKENFKKRHDPFIFMDGEDPWLVWACTKIRRLKRDFSGFKGEEIAIGPSNRKMGHEGAAIYRVGDKYLLFGTAWSTDTMRKGTYNLYYCTADKLEGPYGERRFAGRCLGHGTPFQDKEGRWWTTAFYNANKPTVSFEEAMQEGVAETAHTLNHQGTTLVPLEVTILDDGDIRVSAKDPRYAVPGPEEVQQF